LKTEDLASSAYQRVREAILEGEYEPGAPLFEVHLAARMGMSRTPVREALKVLARDGLVEAVPSRGYFVPRRSMDDLRELFELREALEGMAARCAATRASAEEIGQLQALCDRYAAEQDWAQWAQVGTAFHNLLLTAAHNERLSTMLDSLKDQIILSRRSALQADERRRDAAIHDHRAIVGAVSARDPDAAEAAARRHVRLTYDASLDSYQRGPAPR